MIVMVVTLIFDSIKTFSNSIVTTSNTQFCSLALV